MSKAKPGPVIGTHMGKALSDIIARVVIQTRAATVGAEHEARRRATEQMMDDWEVTLGMDARKLLGPLATMDGLPEGIQMLVDKTSNPTNQTDFILNLLAALGGALGVLFSWGPIYYRQLTNKLNFDHPYIPLSPADAADATVRLGLSLDQAYYYAQANGMDRQSFEYMAQLVGEPPPLDEMRQLLKEGRLSQDDFDTMFRYSRVRNEWETSYLEAHSKSLSAADAVEGYIKGQLSHEDAAALFVTAGGRADQFDLAAAIAGNPIGVEQAGALYNHGLIDQETYASVIKHSRINPQFEGIAELTRFHYLTAYQIETMLSKGTVTAAEATRWLIQDGYPADQVAGLVGGATTTKAAKAKTVALSVVVDAYEAGLINQAQAIAQLVNLGYDTAEAETELQAYDARRILAIMNQGITAVRKSYLADRISQAQASNELDALGVHPSLRDHYLTLWNVEIKTEFKELSMAQIGKLFKDGYMSEGYAVGRWEAMGYSEDDSTWLLYIYGKANPNGSAPVR